MAEKIGMTKDEVLAWARNEIELASDKETSPDAKPEEIEFGLNTLQAALHAFEIMVDDAKNGDSSLHLNLKILTQLINHQPLTPIDDIPENWKEVVNDEWGECYKCTRLESLIKVIKPGKDPVYSDGSRYCCVDINAPDSLFYGGIEARILDEMDPIRFPYHPVGKIRIYVERFSAFPDAESYDTFGVLYFQYPNGGMRKVERFFKVNHETIKTEEISFADYALRRKKWESRMKKEKAAE